MGKYGPEKSSYLDNISNISIAMIRIFAWSDMRPSGVFSASFEHISHFVLVFLLLNLSR